MIVRCDACAHDNVFAQPHRFHAGFASQGFLYNDAGSCTLVWSSFDPAYEAVVGRRHPWALSAGAWKQLEPLLRPAPDGGRWRAKNPPRCLGCGAAIGRPIADGEIYYLVYPGSIITDERPDARHFASVLHDPAAAT